MKFHLKKIYKRLVQLLLIKTVLWEDKQNWQNFSQTHEEKKREESTNKIRDKKGEVTTDNAEIQRLVRDYYEQLYGNKMDNLEEMDRFLEKFNLPRLNQEEMEIANNPITSTEIAAVIKKKKKIPQKTKAQGQMASQENSIKYLDKS